MSSEDSKGTDHLSNRGIDYLVSALRSGVGILPIYGSFLVELVTITIPNQRLDRIANYTRALAKRLARFEKSFLDEQAKRSDFCELVEESFHQAARSTTAQRKSPPSLPGGTYRTNSQIVPTTAGIASRSNRQPLALDWYEIPVPGNPTVDLTPFLPTLTVAPRRAERRTAF